MSSHDNKITINNNNKIIICLEKTWESYNTFLDTATTASIFIFIYTGEQWQN